MNDDEVLAPDSPEEVEGTPEDVPAAPIEEAADEEAPAESEESVAAPDEPAEESPMAPPEKKVPASNTFDVVGKRRPPPTPQELDNEDALFAQDVQRGHLKPETMSDLFAKKDTLGKIGTLFGLLVAGAGSGLTGQPNAVMEMMKNEINNDFEAQKLSNNNAQNWLRLSQQHELQKAQLGQMGIQNELTRAQIGKVPSEIEQNKAHVENMKADTQLKAITAAKTKMAIGAYNYLQNQVDKMPPGQNRDTADMKLKTEVGPAIQQYNSSENAKLSGQLHARAAIRGDLPPPPSPDIDWNKMNLLKASGEAAASMGVPAMPGKAMDAHQVAEATREAGKVQQNRTIYNSWKDSFEHLDRSALGGVVNKGDRDAAIELLSAQISKTTGASTEVAKKQAESLFPGWKDWGNARNEKIKKGAEHFQIQESDTPVLAQFQLKGPFPPPPAMNRKAEVATRETKKSTPSAPAAETKEINGAKYKKVSGGWQKIK